MTNAAVHSFKCSECSFTASSLNRSFVRRAALDHVMMFEHVTVTRSEVGEDV